MKTILTRLAGFLALSFLLTLSVRATVIDLGVYPQPGGEQGGDSAQAELDFLNNTVIANYNAAQDPDLVNATFGTDNIDTDGELTSITINLTGEYSYLKLKWDHQWQYYYIAGETGDMDFDSTAFNQNEMPQALSHYTFFGPGTSVPDGGATAVLLGLALVGVSLASRWLGRSC